MVEGSNATFLRLITDKCGPVFPMDNLFSVLRFPCLLCCALVEFSIVFFSWWRESLLFSLWRVRHMSRLRNELRGRILDASFVCDPGSVSTGPGNPTDEPKKSDNERQ